MVDLKKKVGYELNHIYHMRAVSPVVPIGQTAVSTTVLLTLFEKSLALTSDLKRLPILRSIHFDSEIAATILTNIGTSTIAAIIAVLTAYDGDNLIDDNIIMQSELYYQYNANGAFYKPFTKVWPFVGGYLLHDKVTLKLELYTNAVVAGAAFAAGNVQGMVELEVDWAELSDKEFKDYILENVYAEN